jgi:hypothetical protein
VSWRKQTKDESTKTTVGLLLDQKILFDSGLYMPLIMVIALRPKTLKTMDVRIRLTIQ